MAARSSTVEANPFIAALASEARSAGLRYSSDQSPGIRRKLQGKNFAYVGPEGRSVRDRSLLKRIKRLAIPPAWTDVWICPDENGHLQATGRDAKGRKQYRYHANWREQRDENKFGRMVDFARALPRIRRRVRRDLARSGMPRQKILATIVRLLEATLIRIGNDEYARQNDSYGLTTLRNRHAKVLGSRIRFKFRGKSARKHEISLRDPQLARVVRRCQEMPGQELFCYEEDGQVRDVRSQDVNEYLREISGADFTAKDFRTWAGTVLVSISLGELPPVENAAQAKRNVVAAIEAVAKMLGNTPAVCRKCYVHPEVVAAYLEGEVIPAGSGDAAAIGSGVNLDAAEKAVLKFLVRLQRKGGSNASKS